MATGEFTKEEAQLAKQLLDLLYNALDNEAQKRLWNSYCDVSYFIMAASKAAPSEALRTTKSIVEQINSFIEVEGKGNTRDALNVALTRMQRLEVQVRELERYNGR